MGNNRTSVSPQTETEAKIKLLLEEAAATKQLYERRMAEQRRTYERILAITMDKISNCSSSTDESLRAEILTLRHNAQALESSVAQKEQMVESLRARIVELEYDDESVYVKSLSPARSTTSTGSIKYFPLSHFSSVTVASVAHEFPPPGWEVERSADGHYRITHIIVEPPVVLMLLSHARGYKEGLAQDMRTSKTARKSTSRALSPSDNTESPTSTSTSTPTSPSSLKVGDYVQFRTSEKREKWYDGQIVPAASKRSDWTVEAQYGGTKYQFSSEQFEKNVRLVRRAEVLEIAPPPPRPPPKSTPLWSGHLYPLNEKRFSSIAKEFPRPSWNVLRSDDGHYEITHTTDPTVVLTSLSRARDKKKSFQNIWVFLQRRKQRQQRRAQTNLRSSRRPSSGFDGINKKH